MKKKELKKEEKEEEEEEETDKKMITTIENNNTFCDNLKNFFCRCDCEGLDIGCCNPLECISRVLGCPEDYHDRMKVCKSIFKTMIFITAALLLGLSFMSLVFSIILYDYPFWVHLLNWCPYFFSIPSSLFLFTVPVKKLLQLNKNDGSSNGMDEEEESPCDKIFIFILLFMLFLAIFSSVAIVLVEETRFSYKNPLFLMLTIGSQLLICMSTLLIIFTKFLI
jgi:hypothetical protein